MPELRQNRFSKEWVIIATERAKRPEELRVKREREQRPHFVTTCPFCPGNEHMAPPEVCRVKDPEAGSWSIRVVPNKFPALAREGEPDRKIERSRRSVNGVGIHDVIVESPDHAAVTGLLPHEHVSNILRCYKGRFDAVSADPRIAHVTIFKNHGRGAGTSLEHPHSQMIATPVISHQVRSRLYEAIEHFDDFGKCMFCDALREEVSDGRRIVMLSDHFAALEPYASSTPFATHIFPRRHMASFGDVNDEEIRDLGWVLKMVLAKLYFGLDDPDFNYTIRTAPAETRGVNYYHWYISVIPRLTQVAGFELGTGMFINTVLPEAAAEYLRKIEVPAHVHPEEATAGQAED